VLDLDVNLGLSLFQPNSYLFFVANDPQKSKPKKKFRLPKELEVLFSLKALPRYIHQTFRSLVSEQQETARDLSPIIKDAVSYFPYIVTLFFVLFLLRMTGYQHQLGNYGVEEIFFSQILPLVNQLKSGDASVLKFQLVGPAYPAALHLISWIFTSDVFKTALYLNVILSGLTLLMTYFTTERIFNSATAALVLLLLATNKSFVEFSYAAGSGVLFLFFSSGAVFLFVKALIHSKGRIRPTGWFFFRRFCRFGFTYPCFGIWDLARTFILFDYNAKIHFSSLKTFFMGHLGCLAISTDLGGVFNKPRRDASGPGGPARGF